MTPREQLDKLIRKHTSLVRSSCPRSSEKMIDHYIRCAIIEEGLSDEVLDEYILEFGLWYASVGKLSESFIRKHADQLDWQNVSSFSILSEEFIIEYKNRVCWEQISLNQKLSEEFIIAHKDKFHWINISRNQNLSKKFIKDYISLLFVEHLLQNQKISKETKNYAKQLKEQYQDLL